MLTHHPVNDPTVTFLSGDIRAAVETAAKAAGDKYVEEVFIHLVPVLLGDGVQVFSKEGGDPIHLEIWSVTRAAQVTNLCFWVVG